MIQLGRVPAIVGLALVVFGLVLTLHDGFGAERVSVDSVDSSGSGLQTEEKS